MIIIEKLNGKNFLIWEAQIEAVLMVRVLWKYIEVEVTKTVAGSSEHAKAVLD